MQILIAALAGLSTGMAKAGSDAINWEAAEIIDTGVVDVPSSTGRSVLFAFDAWHVVYEKSGEIFHRARTGSGWEPVERLTDDPAASRNPHIGLGGGFLHLVWEDERTGHPEVWTRRWNGTVWSDEECLTCDATLSTAAAVAGMGDLAQVVWQEGQSPSTIQGRRFEAGAWQPTDVISSGGADAVEPSIAFLEDDEYIDVVWADARLGRYQIFHRSWTESVGWHGEIGITNLPGNSRHPSVHEEICCYDFINPDYFVTFENDQTGVPEIYTVWPTNDPTPRRISLNDGVPSVRPNLHGFMFTHSQCGVFGGVLPSYFVTWTEASAVNEQRIARIVNGTVRAQEPLSSNAQGHSAVGAIEGEPTAGVMAMWVEDGSLYTRRGSVTGCYQSSVDQMGPVFLVGPEGAPANHFRIIDECTGTPEALSWVQLSFSPATEDALTWDLSQGRPPLSARSDGNGDVVVSVRAGGCSEQGGVGLYCFFIPLSGWVGVKSPDITGDCLVSDLDLQIITAKLGTDDFCADLDGSGVVDQADLAIVEATMGDRCASIPSSVDPTMDVDELRLAISPNPVRDHATMHLRVPAVADAGSQQVEVKILDASGRLVRALDPLEVQPGDHRLVWDAKDDEGRSLPSGTYFASIHIGSTHLREAFVVLK